MTLRKIGNITGILLLSVVGMLAQSKAKSTIIQPKTTAQSGVKIIAYYFHGDFRCATCRKLESLSSEVIIGEFAEQLKSDLMEWRVVNTDLPENKHFVTDYKLETRSLVLVKLRDGKETEYKNLQAIWELVQDEPGFRDYVSREIRALLGKG